MSGFLRPILVLLVAMLSAAACSTRIVRPFSIEVQQGNFVGQEMIAQLKPGMTRDQVRFLLGTPLVIDPFHDNRWEYVYTRRRASSNEVESRRITVFFEGDELVRVEGDVVAAGRQ